MAPELRFAEAIPPPIAVMPPGAVQATVPMPVTLLPVPGRFGPAVWAIKKCPAKSRVINRRIDGNLFACREASFVVLFLIAFYVWGYDNAKVFRHCEHI